jgi:hypothetical protein
MNLSSLYADGSWGSATWPWCELFWYLTIEAYYYYYLLHFYLRYLQLYTQTKPCF